MIGQHSSLFSKSLNWGLAERPDEYGVKSRVEKQIFFTSQSGVSRDRFLSSQGICSTTVKMKEEAYWVIPKIKLSELVIYLKEKKNTLMLRQLL